MKTTALFLAILLCLALSAPPAFSEMTQAPCIDPPYFREYRDENKTILINRIESGNIVYFVADVQVANPSVLHAEMNEHMMSVSGLAARAGAVLAINGDDYAVHDHGIIIRNGRLLRAGRTSRNQLIVDKNGDMSVRIDRKNEDVKAIGEELATSDTWQSFEFGPALVKDGQALPFSPDFDLISTRPTRLESRTAIGQIGPLHYIIIVVDGRQEGYSIGVSLQDLQQLFLKYGAKTALNLDGGGSSELWFQGEIINRPAGGKERQVSDIICF